MRIEQAPVQLQNANFQHSNPIPAGIGQSHSSILQNNSCCGSIGKALYSILDCIKNIFKRLCCCFYDVQQERTQATPGVTTLAQANRHKNSMLDHLCNRNNVQAREIDFVGAPNFKAAIIFKLGDQIIDSHTAEVNIGTLENAFRDEVSRRMERVLQERAPDGMIRGESLYAYLIVVIAREDGRFDGKSLNIRCDIGTGSGGNGSEAWPGRIPQRALASINAVVPHNRNEALFQQLGNFLLNLPLRDRQPNPAQQ